MLHRTIMRKSITSTHVHLRGNKSKLGLEVWVIKLVKHCTATEPTSKCDTQQRSDVVTGVGAGTSRTRDRQFTWRHNTYSYCSYVCYITITGGSSQRSAVALFNLHVAASERIVTWMRFKLSFGIVCNTHSNLCITFVVADNFDEIITCGLILFILQLKLRERTETNNS